MSKRTDKLIYHLRRVSNHLRTIVALPFLAVAALFYGLWYIITDTD